MQQITDRRRGVWRAALALAAGLGPAFVFPFAASANLFIDTAHLAQEERANVQRLVVAEAVGNGTVPAPLALAVVQVESDFVPRTISSSGAIGLMQILPATAKSELGAAADTLWDPATNVRLGLRRLARLHNRYDGDWELALSHFRGGELPRVDGRYQAHDYTRAYVERVMRCWRRFQRDVLVRTWIREASGAPRFVAGDTSLRFEPPAASGRGSAHWRHWRHEPRPVRHRHRGHYRTAEGCDETVAPRRRFGHRFNGGGGRWTAVEGGPARRVHRSGRWVAVTGGRRFR